METAQEVLRPPIALVNARAGGHPGIRVAKELKQSSRTP
jgi:hypothetical protein